MKSLSLCNPVILHIQINFEVQEHKESKLINAIAKKYLKKFEEKKKFIAVITSTELKFIKNKKAKQLHLIN